MKINEWITKNAWARTRKKKQSFKSKTFQRLIFVLSTTHFRIHQSLSTAFFIHERRSFSMNFRKNLTNDSISILNRSKWSTSRLIKRKQACLAWKTQDFSHEERHSQSWMTSRHLHDVFSSRMRSCKRSLHRRWLNQLTQKSKNEAKKFTRKKNSIKKCSSHSMSSLFNYWDNNF
jgi:hypothetical protein